MPELPEVQTTVNGLRKTVVGLKIIDVWSDYNSPHHKGTDNIKDRQYFDSFKKEILGAKIISTERRAKNILINLDNSQTILIHMKMTGHLLFGEYRFYRADSIKDNQTHVQEMRGGKTAKRSPWIPVGPESLKDPFNRHIHFVISFANDKRLALCDSRKFAKVTLLSSVEAHRSDHLNNIGPEPLEKSFTVDRFVERLNKRPNGKIKQVLMDQKIIAGVGNIYADEALWRAGIHPLERVENITNVKTKDSKAVPLFKAIKEVLAKGIDFGGDSMSDYRNIHGERGKFQEKHHAYRRTGEKCDRKGCNGTIRRIMVGSRSAHYCDRHQKLIK